MIAQSITVRGIVQGVGFRPFIYRLAHELKLKGWVRNSNEAVRIHVEGAEDSLALFAEAIHRQAPPAAQILDVEIAETQVEGYADFAILDSANVSEAVTRVSPDIAVCEACLHDMDNQPHRRNYPLVNCCHCGPRFSIIEQLPYDRPNTSMRVFEMCEQCRKEYNNPADRRFHAQPVACNACGPHYTLHVWNGNEEFQTDDFDGLLKQVAEEIAAGKVFAIKSIGGYNLVCDALNEEAVRTLRLHKRREGKPFAVMFRDLETLKRYAWVGVAEKKLLTSFRRPIVILNLKLPLAPSVSVGFPTVGAMLPYMPFHYLLFRSLPCDALVVTSGNMHDEPIIVDDAKAIETWVKKIAGVVSYNRNIINRVDDSVLSSTGTGEVIFIRRARGYVPEPIRVVGRNFEGIFAAGAELTGTFAMGKADEVLLSQYLGDLKNFDNFQFYQEAYERFCRLFRFTPRWAVADLHPDYHSTVFAERLGVPMVYVQHHHAHVASVMAEYGIDEPVIGIAWDGTGMGIDQHIWGGEFLICTPAHFERYGHFEYIPLPGGDRVVDEPWRTALSFAYKFWGKALFEKNLPFISQVDAEKLQSLLIALEKNINCPLSCSAGRLFDAVAVILGAGIEPSFHAEFPMRIESLIDPEHIFSPYPFEITQNIVSFAPTFESIVDDLPRYEKKYIAGRFHDTLVAVAIEMCNRMRDEKRIEKVILSGGTFQNKYLFTKIKELLEVQNFKVFTHRQVPPNDGGIALGQMYVAASKIFK